MRRACWMFVALAVVVSSLALAASERSKAARRRFLDYLPVGSHVVLHWIAPTSPYDIRVLTAKQVAQRPDELARYEKKREDMLKELAEVKQRRDPNTGRRANDLQNRLPHVRPPDVVYRVAAAGEDFVELQVEWQPPARTAEVESGIVLPLASIREIRLPTETGGLEKEGR